MGLLVGLASFGMKKGRRLCLIKIVKNDVTYKKDCIGCALWHLMQSFLLLSVLF